MHRVGYQEALVEEATNEVPLPETESAAAPPEPVEGSGKSVRNRLTGIAKRVMARLPHTRGATSYTWFCGYWMGFVVDG